MCADFSTAEDGAKTNNGTLILVVGAVIAVTLLATAAYLLLNK